MDIQKMQSAIAKRELARVEKQRIAELSDAQRKQFDTYVENVRAVASRPADDGPISGMLADAIMDGALALSVLHDDLPSHVLLRIAAGLRRAEAESAGEIILDRLAKLLGVDEENGDES